MHAYEVDEQWKAHMIAVRGTGTVRGSLAPSTWSWTGELKDGESLVRGTALKKRVLEAYQAWSRMGKQPNTNGDRRGVNFFSCREWGGFWGGSRVRVRFCSQGGGSSQKGRFYLRWTFLFFFLPAAEGGAKNLSIFHQKISIWYSLWVLIGFFGGSVDSPHSRT